MVLVRMMNCDSRLTDLSRLANLAPDLSGQLVLSRCYRRDEVSKWLSDRQALSQIPPLLKRCNASPVIAVRCCLENDPTFLILPSANLLEGGKKQVLRQVRRISDALTALASLPFRPTQQKTRLFVRSAEEAVRWQQVLNSVWDRALLESLQIDWSGSETPLTAFDESQFQKACKWPERSATVTPERPQQIELVGRMPIFPSRRDRIVSMAPATNAASMHESAVAVH